LLFCQFLFSGLEIKPAYIHQPPKRDITDAQIVYSFIARSPIERHLNLVNIGHVLKKDGIILDEGKANLLGRCICKPQLVLYVHVKLNSERVEEK
jgi:hypothetical protein